MNSLANPSQTETASKNAMIDQQIDIFACAETDVYAPMEIIEKVKDGMTGANAEVEIYPGTHHGFAFPKRPIYHRDAAERHWKRLLALYRRNLAGIAA